jgi:hypothetical protein
MTRRARPGYRAAESSAVPLTGDINVTIYGGDRQLWRRGRVHLVMLDPFADDRKVVVDHFTSAKATSVMLTGAPADAGQRYALVASAKGRREVGVYPVQPIPSGVRHTAVMLVEDEPAPDFSTATYANIAAHSPSFAQALVDGGVAEPDFLGLPKIRRAAALNIEAKLRATPLLGVPAVELIRRIDGTDGIQQDRILCEMDAAIVERVAAEASANDSFFRVPDWANEVFHRGFPTSYKQRVPFGSLQFSFGAVTGGRVAADIDIDLFTDIGHLGEVVRNHLTSAPTDPYTVYVQLFDQRVFPLYVMNEDA